MAEKDFPGEPAPIDPPKPPRRKRALILKIVAAVAVLIVLLILLAPTLISSGPIVSIALGQVNKQLNGKVEISSASLGWFTGVKIEGVRVLDASNAQIAELDHVVVPLPLWKAALGKLNFGDVIVDGVSFDAKYDADGKLNFAELKKAPPPPAAPAAGPTPPQPPPPPAEKPNPAKIPYIS